MSNPICEKTTSCIRVCNDLLQVEVSAVDCYLRTATSYLSTPVQAELTRIGGEHRRSATRLAASVRSLGGVPAAASAASPVFCLTPATTAPLFGPDSAIAALQQGEEAGRRSYHAALQHADVTGICKTLIHTELLPRIEAHLACLDDLPLLAG